MSNLKAICDKPDSGGNYNRRCQHVIDAPKGETEPRQCKRAAERGTPFCGTHCAVKWRK